MREMRAIAFVTKLIDDHKISGNSLKRMLIHGIEAADVMAELSALHKLNADWDNAINTRQWVCHHMIRVFEILVEPIINRASRRRRGRLVPTGRGRWSVESVASGDLREANTA